MGLFLPAIFTYVFWFVIAKIDGPETVGIVSTIVSFVIILTTIFSFDLQLGMKRLLSKHHIEKNEKEYKNIFTSVFLFLTVTSILASVLIIYPINFLEMIGIDSNYYWIIVSAIFLLSYHNLFVESFITSMRSKDFFGIILLGSLLRFPVLVILYYVLYYKEFSAALSYYSLYFTVVALSLIQYVKKIDFNIPWSTLISTIRNLINTSINSWIPNIIYTSGFWMGIIIVFSLHGSQAGGQFYIAVGIFSVILFIVSGISKVTHGYIQSIKEKDRLFFLSYCIKIALILTIPLSTSILFFSSSYLGILGVEFKASQFNLSILMLGMPFVVLSEIIYYYLYGLGQHKKVLILGLIGNVPRVTIYFLISFLFDTTFVALSYLIGSVLQCIFSLRVVNPKIQIYEIRRKIMVTIIPFIIATPLWLFDVNFIVATVIILSASIVLYVRLDYFDRVDVSKILHAVLPNKRAEYFSKLFDKVIVFIRK